MIKSLDRVTFAGTERRILTLAAGASAPLVIVLHSAYTTVEKMSALIDAEGLCVRDNVNVVLPEGLPAIAPRWDDNPNLGCSRGIPDVQFLHYTLTRAIDQINPGKVFLAGFSNGSFMIHRFLHDGDGAMRVHGAACVSGALLNVYTKDPVMWAMARPVPMLTVNGDADNNVAYGGSLGVLSVPATARHYRDAFGSPPGATFTDVPDTVADGTTTTISTWGPENQLYTVNHGGHAWPGSTKNLPTAGNVSMDFDATRVASRFFSML